MSFSKYPFWEVVKHAFSKEVWDTLWPAVWDTLYMVVLSALITLVLGVLLGIALSVISKDGVRPIPVLNETAGTIVNCLRSLPQMIMIIVTLPLARMILGQSYANIIVTTPDKKDDPGLKALVEVLQSEDTAKFILEKYNGAVIPVTKVSE